MPLFRRKDNDYEDAARLLSDGKTQDAIEGLRDILRKNPQHKNAMITLAVALLEVQEDLDRESPLTTEAFDLLDMATELTPNDVVPLFNKGVCQRKLGFHSEALATFERILEIDDRQTLAILHMAEINYELKNWEKAIELARLALIRDPGVEGALFWVKDAIDQAALEGVELNLADDKLSTSEGR
jgi:tetratricopeptide (TPR) repeat protein